MVIAYENFDPQRPVLPQEIIMGCPIGKERDLIECELVKQENLIFSFMEPKFPILEHRYKHCYILLNSQLWGSADHFWCGGIRGDPWKKF